jgi:hypothetical protein
MKQWFFAAAGSLALISAGIVHGFWTDRWVQSADTAQAASLLPGIPHEIGEWKGEDLDIKPAPGVTGSLQRAYTNRRLGTTVIMALVCGRPGPVATHTPEACYGASGYVVEKRRPFRVDVLDNPAHFWTSDAVRTNVSQETRVRIYWAWNGGPGWVAASDARQSFPRFRYPVLHKLYVLRELSSDGDTTRDEPCEAFLQLLLPELNRTLFTPGS